MSERVKLGKSTYFVRDAANPAQVGGVDRFVVCSNQHPVVVNRSSGQTFYVTYKSKRKARATAINLTAAGLPCGVFDKEINGYLRMEESDG